MKYCKICKHNFNSGETFAKIGSACICANCAFTTTVFDLIKKNLLNVETFDPIPANAVVYANSDSDNNAKEMTVEKMTAEEIDDIAASSDTPLDYLSGKQQLNSVYGIAVHGTVSEVTPYDDKESDAIIL